MKFLLPALALSVAAGAQPRPSFEVASVKENKSSDRPFMDIQFLPGGRFVARNTPLFFIIVAAYNLPFQSDRLAPQPDWIVKTRYDIEATPPAGAHVSTAQMRAMLQTLLEDRFKMTMHREMKDRPVYAILVAKDGPKLKKSALNEKDCEQKPAVVGDPSACHSLGGGQGRGLHGKAVAIADLGPWVSNWSDRPVIDKSGLTGLYEIDTVGWIPMRPKPPRPDGQPQTAEEAAAADPITPTLFGIFDRIGLKLESQRAPVEMFTIESIEKPSAN